MGCSLPIHLLHLVVFVHRKATLSSSIPKEIYLDHTEKFISINQIRNSENTKWILHYLSLQVLKIYSTLMATGDRRTGPSCWGSPARTSCPPPGVSVLNIPARGTKHSGCREWPASSMNTWVKWWLGISAETNLKRKNKETNFKRGKSTVIVVLIWKF